MTTDAEDQILIIMPTRGRPWLALEAIASLMQTADEPNRLAIAVCCDVDDEGQVWLSIGKHKPSLPIFTFLSERRRFISWVNHVVKPNIIDNFGRYSWSHVAWWGDDVRMHTRGWDTMVRAHEKLMVYGDDLYQGQKMATHPFVRVEVPLALGYLLPSELIHSCADTFIEALCRACDSVVYDQRIITEHLHPDAGKGLRDQTYDDARALYAEDRATMDRILPTIPELAKKVMDYYGKTKVS